MKRKVLLVDDHVAIRLGLQDILAVDVPGLEFGGAHDYSTAFRLATTEPWHLAIVDLDLPDGRSGLDLIRSLQEAGCHTPVLIYSVHSEEQFGMRSLKAGAQGYLSKADKAEEVVKAVRALLAGERYISPPLAVIMADTLLRNAPQLAHESLSEREFAVFRALAYGHPAVQIAADLQLSPKTVSTYRSRVLLKLNLKSTSDLIRYAIDHKLV